MTRGLVWVVLGLALALPAAAAERMRGVAVTEERIALVIGNAAYRADPLDNPVNDARLVAQSLRQAGFAVRVHENLDRRALVEALRDFGNRLGENTIAALYYAGHGLQLRDRNFLIPVDAEIRSEDEIPIAGVDVGFLLGRMATARSRINIVILDACRNNPFSGAEVLGPDGRRLKFRGATPAGLARVEAPLGSMVAFSTAPGGVALDNPGEKNSLYTKHLLSHIRSPGLPVELLFKQVRLSVARETGRVQVPWESSSLTGDYCFRLGPQGSCSTAR